MAKRKLFNCFDTYNPSKPPFDKGGLCPPPEEKPFDKIRKSVSVTFVVTLFFLCHVFQRLFNCFDTYNPSKPPFDKGGLCPPSEENILLQFSESVTVIRLGGGFFVWVGIAKAI